MRTNYGFGLYKSPIDKRDYLMESFFKTEISLPSFFDSPEPTGPQTNQKDEGACAGHEAKNAKERHEWVDNGHFIELSARDIYERAKKISGSSEGTTLIAIAKALMEGIAEEDFWPYEANNPNTGPKSGIEKNRAKYKIGGYARITGIDAMKRTIFEGYPKALLYGMQVYKGFISDQSKTTGVVSDPTCWDRVQGPLGGHAIFPGANSIEGRTGCGWNDNSEFFKGDGHMYFKGSWGNFGFHGYHIVSYKNIKANGLDCICILDEKTIKEAKKKNKILTVASIKKEKGVWV